MANLLEGLEFLSTKGRIKNHIRQRSQMLQQIQGDTTEAKYSSDNSVLWVIEDNLPPDNKRRYNGVCEIEKAAGLVTERR